ncbi:MAG: phenylalanine--tRNA ligase beta subunit-related protein [Duncaniella sp.]|nr:phenylalanine--tRNA ligase beta subunit-related protein [Muribaculum sp.]MCM1255767.1 phenylalanine--tRNA ligase beta subunit-related protein [Duncaniella sp.]
MNIKFEDKIKAAAPGLRVVTIEADVENKDTSDELWGLISRGASDMRNVLDIPDINKRNGIRATREAYKKLGKEPNRYRPSCEALCRRLVKGLELYRINALVDIINLISIQSGYSIGGFDMDKIQGDSITLGVGMDGEPFEAIGRGELNIANMPVYRDAVGGIGTPTSDNERTKLDIDTKRLLMCVNIYGEEMPPEETVALTTMLLGKFVDAKNIDINTFRP